MFDGSAIRELEGSVSGSINGMDITSDGAYFVTGEWVDETRKEVVILRAGKGRQ